MNNSFNFDIEDPNLEDHSPIGLWAESLAAQPTRPLNETEPLMQVAALRSEVSYDPTSPPPKDPKLYDDKEKFRCRTVVFTCYAKHAIDDPESWLRTLQKSCAWTMGQLEKCPSTGRVHIQGMANSKNDIAWKMLSGESCWKRRCIAPEKSIEYVSKAKSKLDGPWEFGERPKFGQKNKSEHAKEIRMAQSELILNTDLLDLVKNGELSWDKYIDAKKFKTTYLADANILKQSKEELQHVMDHEWIWGATGTGKTTYARTTFPDHFIKNKNKWWCDYAGQETVIIEDLGKSDAIWIGDKLKEWADKWPFKAEIKGGHIMIRPKRLIVTSNYQIEELWEDSNIVNPLLRRFNVINKQ